MTLTELRYVVAVARERHFGRAAESCSVSQPTLSISIKKLEDELEVRIFERGTSDVSVTPIGDEIVRQAQAVLDQVASIDMYGKTTPTLGKKRGFFQDLFGNSGAVGAPGAGGGGAGGGGGGGDRP